MLGSEVVVLKQWSVRTSVIINEVIWGGKNAVIPHATLLRASSLALTDRNTDSHRSVQSCNVIAGKCPPPGLSPETVSYTNMSLHLATGLEPLNGNRKTPVEFEARLLGGNMAAWRRERFERGGLQGGKLERKLKKSEVNHLDVLAVRHPSVSPADKAVLRFLWWSSASGRAARVLLRLSFQRLSLLCLYLPGNFWYSSPSYHPSCHLSFLMRCIWRCWVPQECLSGGVWANVAQCSSS